MNKKTKLRTLFVCCLAVLLLFAGPTIAKYFSEITQNFSIAISGRNYEDIEIDHTNTDAYTLEDGVLTVKKYFFVPNSPSAEDTGDAASIADGDNTTTDNTQGKWYKTIGLKDYAFAEISVTNEDGTTLGGYNGAPNVTKIVIPKTVETIGQYALACPDLTAITLEEGNEKFTMSEHDNNLYTTGENNEKILVRHIKTDETYYTVPADVTSILGGAFTGSGYYAIVTTMHDDKAWGATNAIMVDITQLDGEIGSVSYNADSGYTVTLTGDENNVYYKNITQKNEKKLPVAGNTITIPADPHDQIVLLSPKYAFGYVYTVGEETVLEIHNCDPSITGNNVTLSCTNGNNQPVTLNQIYNLPTDSLPGECLPIENASVWENMSAASITKVIVADAITPNNMNNWFSNFSDKLDTLELKAKLGADGTTLGTETGLHNVITGWTTERSNAEPETIELFTENIPLDTPATYESVTYCYATTHWHGDTNNTYMRVYQRKYVPKGTEKYSDGKETYTVAEIRAWPSGINEDCRSPMSNDKPVTRVPNWNKDINSYAISFTVVDKIQPLSLAHWFQKFVKCEEYILKELDTSQVSSLAHMFDQNTHITTEIFDSMKLNFRDSKVTDLSFMFYECDKLTTIDLRNVDLNTTTVTTMHRMFDNCNNLQTIFLPQQFNTSNVTNMKYMFRDCKLLRTIYVKDNFQNVPTNIIDGSSASFEMFSGCQKLVGGNGTTYSSANKHHTYACIDKEGTPGYFTQYSTAPRLFSDVAGISFENGTSFYKGMTVGEENNVSLNFTESITTPSAVTLTLSSLTAEPKTTDVRVEESPEGKYSIRVPANICVNDNVIVITNAEENVALLNLLEIDLNLAAISNFDISFGDWPTAGEIFRMCMTPKDGYSLPDYITVIIDGVTYQVATNGIRNEGEPWFDATSSMLTIPADLLTETTKEIVICAEAIPSEEEKTSCTKNQNCTLEDGHEGECELLHKCEVTTGCMLLFQHKGPCNVCIKTEGCVLGYNHEGDCQLAQSAESGNGGNTSNNGNSENKIPALPKEEESTEITSTQAYSYTS